LFTYFHQQPSEPGELTGVTIIVVDAITKQPIEKASVELKQVVYCPEGEGYPCPEGLLLKKETNKEGKAVFYDTKLKELLEKTSFMITVSAENYSSSTKELPFSLTPKTITVELIGGNIAVKTRDTAISYAKKDRRLINWLFKHPNAHSYPVVDFVSPYWTVEYNDKTTCKYYDPSDINCAIIVKIDARTGEVIEVLPEWDKEVPTMMDIPHLNLTPQPGEYFTYRGNKSKILLNDSRLKYCFLELKDICPPDAATVGDPGIVITGTIKNEYDRDYFVCMAAHAFNSEGERIGGSIDPGPICGVIAPYVKCGQTGNFELHLKYREDIERIELFVGCVSEIPPP
jgi:hypothetical protein